MATRTIYPYGSPGTSVGGGQYILVDTLPTAGTSTLGNIYLVPNGNTKDMYITVTSGNGYAWTKIGNTAIDLAGYATESWVEARDVDLTVAEYEALVNANQVDPDKRYFVDE